MKCFACNFNYSGGTGNNLFYCPICSKKLADYSVPEKGRSMTLKRVHDHILNIFEKRFDRLGCSEADDWESGFEEGYCVALVDLLDFIEGRTEED